MASSRQQLLFANDQQLARDYFSQLAASIETISHGDAQGLQWEFYFVRGVCLLGDDFPVDEGVIQKVRDTFEKDKASAGVDRSGCSNV